LDVAGKFLGTTGAFFSYYIAAPKFTRRERVAVTTGE
jgi:hypothetical protein